MAEAAAPKSGVVDGRITLALLVTVALEAIAALLWVGAAAQRLDGLEARVNAQANVVERLARLEAQMSGARATLDRIETNLDRRGRP
jgi:type VI protein secretion system component VasK